MLGELLGELERVRCGRVVRRRATAVGACALLLGLAVAGALWAPVGGRTAAPVADRSAGAATPLVTISVVETDPSVLVRLSSSDSASGGVTVGVVSGRTGLVQELDDRGLVRALAEIGRPAGVVRMGDRVWVTAAVTDRARSGS